MCGSKAISARIAASDNDYALACRNDLLFARETITRALLVLLRQVIHREVNALQLAAWYRKIPMLLGTHRQQHCIEIAKQCACARADFHIRPELHSFS